MFTFVLTVLFLIAAAAAFGGSFATVKVTTRKVGYNSVDTDFYPRRYVRIGAAVCLGLAFVFLFFSSLQQVSTKNVGVKTSFGKPTGHLSNGLHFIKPWEKVTEFPAAIQTDSHVGDANKEAKDGECTSVRIANQSVACVDNSVRWRINPAHVESLYQDYKNFDHVRDSLVSRELKAALNDVFASYDPLKTLVDQSAAGSQVTTPNLDTLAIEVAKNLQARIGAEVEILNVIIPLVGHDPDTQGKINAFQAALADTRIAIQKQQTADAEAKANKILSDSISNDPNVLVSKCLDLIKGGFLPPAGFNCWPGGGSAIVVPATK